VASEARQANIHQKAKALNDSKLLHKISGYGDETIDMIAADFRYHKYCLDRYLQQSAKKK
jgi:hypothetical protein